jgi:type III pantothenate kinase
MLLCLDVGNTNIVGTLFEGKKIGLRFRYATAQVGTSDQFGLFLRDILSTNGLDHAAVTAVAVSSVVPGVNFSIRHALTTYFPKAAQFTLQASAMPDTAIKSKNPSEVGADLIAGALGAIDAHPHKNLIDLGTATTLAAVTKKAEFLGCVIMPGIRLAMESLKANTAKLMEVDIAQPTAYLGQSTRECIQNGLYYGHLGAMREIVAGYNRELFADEPAVVVGTGGFSQMFKDQKVFDDIQPDLVSQGIRVAYEKSKAA